MIQIHGFTDLNVALRLKELAFGPPDNQEGEPTGETVSWLLQTPAGGIGGYSGYSSPVDEEVVPSAWCKCWYLYRDGDQIKIRKAYGPDGSQLELLIANLLPESIDGNRLGRATTCRGGALLVDWMSCG